MGTKVNYETEEANYEAEVRTQFEKQRILSYGKLRYDYEPISSRIFYFSMFKKRYQKFKPKRDANNRDARKSLRIGFISFLMAQFNRDKKIEMNKMVIEKKMQIQKQIDSYNQRENDRCNRVNTRIENQIDDELKALAEGNKALVEEYFSAVLQQDDYSIDGEERFEIHSAVGYDPLQKRLVIDYRLPSLDEVSDIKEWKIGKNNELVNKSLSKSEFLFLYERIILDLAVRVSGLIFDSDDQLVVSEIVFNGSCVYETVADNVVYIISMLVTKSEFEGCSIRRSDFLSKKAISKFSKVNYLGDINVDTPPRALTDNPPLNIVIPIQSNLYSN
jgi:hypothetical protein